MNRFVWIILILFEIFMAQTVLAAPAEVVILRHAEKPRHGHNLSKLGYARANALVGFFTLHREIFPQLPTAIYAMAPNSDDGSLRAIETMNPLAQSLNLDIHSNFERKEVAPLTYEILHNSDYDNKMVIICWEHNMIPKIAKEFGVKDAPHEWPGKIYDRVWIIDFQDGQVVNFRNIQQELLPGSLPTPDEPSGLEEVSDELSHCSSGILDFLHCLLFS